MIKLVLFVQLQVFKLTDRNKDTLIIITQDQPIVGYCAIIVIGDELNVRVEVFQKVEKILEETLHVNF